VVSASPNEATLVEPTLQRRFLRETPERLIGDKAYDSDPLDQRVREHLRVELIAPAPLEPEQTSHTGRPRAAALSSSLENRASVCLASQLSSHRHSLGILPREFPRNGSTRMRCHPPEAFMICVLET
jgi:hypothetical protein